MKKLNILLVALVLISLPQTANAGNYYWGGRVLMSSMDIESFKLKLKNTPGLGLQTVDLHGSEKDTVVGASLIYGFDFGWAGNVPLRLEGETTLRQGSSYSSNKTYSTYGILPVSRIEVDLDIEASISQSLSLWLDIPVGKFPVKPYIGAGVGIDFYPYDVDVVVNRNTGVLTTTDSRSGWETAWHYNFGGGLFTRVGKRLFLDLNFKYSKTHDWKIKMRPYELEFESQAFDTSLGVRYYF